MAISKEEIIHIANLADLNIKEDEVEEYAKNLQDILNFVEILKNVNTENIEESIGIGNSFNVFRKDEVKEFEDTDALLQNAPEAEKVMAYIVMAYNEALNGSTENILLLKNGVQIPPNDILDINPLSIWK